VATSTGLEPATSSVTG